MKPLYFLLFIYLFSCSKQKTANNKEISNPFYDKAFDYRESNELDSAFKYFNLAKDLFLQQKDSIGIGKCLVNMGMISTNKGDYYGGQEISLSAISYFNEKDTNANHLSFIKANLNNLGISFYNLKDYNQAIKFYQQSLAYASDSTALVIKNNIANAYREKKDLKKALALYDDILKEGINNKTEYSRALTNSAITKWLQNPQYDAVPNLLKALHIREERNNLEDLSASYAHLSNFYLQKQPDSSLFYASKMYGTAQRTSNAEDRLLALHNLIKLSPEREAKRYFEIYQNLNDSVIDARNNAKNQFAFIRYESEKSKEENLILQKDNTEKKYQLIKQKSLLIGGLILAFFTIVVSIVVYRKRKQRLELEAQNAIRENQLKTSKKVHDVVANGLYRIMTKLDNQEALKDDPIVDEIEELYEKSRDISYEEKQFTVQNFHEKLTTLLKSFATSTTEVLIIGNDADIWDQISAATKYELEHILQELMVNMKKHSQASKVILQFEQEANQLKIYYSDNGIGMSREKPFNNGLTNTGNRMNGIKGTITFDTAVEKGLKIQLSFPVS